MPGAAAPHSPSIDSLWRVRWVWWGSATRGVRGTVGEDVGGGGQTGLCVIEIWTRSGGEDVEGQVADDGGDKGVTGSAGERREAGRTMAHGVDAYTPCL
jgi:hypothetical protein